MSNPLHLYRALLRESTYLPDIQARTWAKDYVRARFRRYQPPLSLSRINCFKAFQSPTSTTTTASTRRIALLKQAEKGLLLLSKANAGYSKSLQRVLEYTYGRIGPRRHQLLADILKPDTPKDESALRSFQQGLEVDRELRWSTKARALGNSQRTHNIDHNPRPVFRSLKVKIPETNSWGRPMPKCRVKNQVLRFRSSILSRFHAPLPINEWTRLRDLTLGRTEWKGLVPRRPTGRTVIGRETSDQITQADSPLLLSTLKRQVRSKERPHSIDARYMRRCWAYLLLQCPVMTYNTAKEAWTVHWFSNEPKWQADQTEQSKMSPKHPTAYSFHLGAQVRDSSYFAGVDENGQLVTSPTP